MLKSNARENQDLVIVTLFDGKRQGTYLEIGGGTPVVDNSTYLLEKEFDWQGISIELDTSLVKKWPDSRKNICLAEDATTIDYSKLLLDHKLGTKIDFLQIDVDGTNTAKNNTSMKVLESIDFKKLSFGFATFEHNLYLNDNNIERTRSREIFLDHGYTMLISDVMHDNLIFEDWYVLERLMPNKNWRAYQGNKVKMNGKLPDNIQRVLDQIIYNHN